MTHALNAFHRRWRYLEVALCYTIGHTLSSIVILLLTFSFARPANIQQCLPCARRTYQKAAMTSKREKILVFLFKAKDANAHTTFSFISVQTLFVCANAYTSGNCYFQQVTWIVSVSIASFQNKIKEKTTKNHNYLISRESETWRRQQTHGNESNQIHDALI